MDLIISVTSATSTLITVRNLPLRRAWSIFVSIYPVYTVSLFAGFEGNEAEIKDETKQC